jgi:hypothetical protein
VIALPVMGVMYMDMNNATAIAVEEVKRIREVRRKYIQELKDLRNAYENPIGPNDQGQ